MGFGSLSFRVSLCVYVRWAGTRVSEDEVPVSVIIRRVLEVQGEGRRGEHSGSPRPSFGAEFSVTLDCHRQSASHFR